MTAALDATGHAQLKLEKLKAGKHKLVVAYAGSATVSGSSDSLTLKVRKRH